MPGLFFKSYIRYVYRPKNSSPARYVVKCDLKWTFLLLSWKIRDVSTNMQINSMFEIDKSIATQLKQFSAIISGNY